MQKQLLASAILFLCLSLSLAHFHVHTHDCIHDDIDHQVEWHHKLTDEDIITARRDLAGETYAPMRIVARYDNLTGIPQDQIDFIKNTLMPATIKFFSQSLSVIPVPGNLIFDNGNCNSAPIPQSVYTKGEAADLILLVTAFPTDAGTIAWASPCRIWSDGRPILGQVNFNPTHINTSPAAFAGSLAVLQHEITHIMGFSSGLYGLWKTNAPVGQSVVTTPVKYRGTDGRALNTTRVVELARRHFGCSNISALEIENQGGGGSLGSHWERRLLGNEAMTASAVADARYSAFTFALLEDSGWYKANYTMAAPLAYGYQKGCSFVFQTCIDTATKTSRFPEFCSNINAASCTIDGLAKGVCAASKTSTPVFNYFGDGTVGFDGFGDECPTLLPYSNGLCADTTQGDSWWIPEKHGNASRCFSGTLIQEGYQVGSTWFGCYPTSCKALNGVTRLYVTLGANEYLCPQGGGKITNVKGYSGDLDCPSEKHYCPTNPPVINPNVAATTATAISTEKDAGKAPSAVPTPLPKGKQA